jgi:hypothetical protein
MCAGFYHISGQFGTPAEICPENSFCPVGSVSVSACPSNTASPAGSSKKEDCRSITGYYGVYGTEANICPKNSYCPTKSEQPLSCPTETVSPEGSSSKLDCVEKALYPAQCDPSTNKELSQFLLCVFRSEIGLGAIPRMNQADTGQTRLYFVGQGSVPVVDMHDLQAFRSYVPATPSANYAWAILGSLKISSAGMYKFCISSDDG